VSVEHHVPFLLAAPRRAGHLLALQPGAARLAQLGELLASAEDELARVEEALEAGRGGRAALARWRTVRALRRALALRLGRDGAGPG